MSARPAAVHPAPVPLAPSAGELALLRTVLYASLFRYPLTLAQARQTLIETVCDEAGLLALYRGSALLQRLIDYRDGYFFRRGCEHVIDERRRSEVSTRQMLDRHRRLLRLVCAIPFTAMVALSGSAAHLNARGRGSDLDLFIITRGRHVWSVTLTIILLARLLRRRALLCVNFVIADAALAVEPEDLFTANQIIHLRPLMNADLYRTFVDANSFVNRCYPNFVAPSNNLTRYALGPMGSRLKRGAEIALGVGIARTYEAICRLVYGRHLRRRAETWESPEGVRLLPLCLKLHTRSHRRPILELFEELVDRTLQQATDEQVPS